MRDTSGSYYPRPNLKVQPSEYADTTFQAYAEKISDDYDFILRKVVVPGLPNLGDLKLREIRILASLDFFDSPLSPMQVSELLRYDPATVTRAANVLVKCGMIYKKNNRRDTRSILLVLTDKGQAMADNYSRRVRMAFKAMEKDMLHGLSEDEKTTFLNIMLKVNRRSQTMRAMCQNYDWDFDTDGPVAKPLF